MKIVADENTLQVTELFSPLGEVVTLPGRSIGSGDLRDADVLLVRSVTQVNERLLADSSVRFVGSATTGLDHIDQVFLRGRGIEFAYAPGCNAGAVVQYVLSVMASQRPEWRQLTVGIIGCGNVGGELDKLLHDLGVVTRCYDPFLTLEENPRLVTRDQALSEDIICLHTPLTRDGAHPTYHLLGEKGLSRLKPGALVINAGRGAVIDGRALAKLVEPLELCVALDVWEHEPQIAPDLLQKVAIATPHIAGYSRDGKLAGTRMVYSAFCRWLGRDGAEETATDGLAPLEADSLNQAILQSYDARQDDRVMRERLDGIEDTAQIFDKLRKEYPQRLEPGNFLVTGNFPGRLREDLARVGFSLPG